MQNIKTGLKMKTSNILIIAVIAALLASAFAASFISAARETNDTTLIKEIPNITHEKSSPQKEVRAKPLNINATNIQLENDDPEIRHEAENDLDASASALGIGWNKVQTLFTFNSEKKMMLELKLAKMRLIQAKVAAQNNNTDAMVKALEAHQQIMLKIEEKLNAIAAANNGELDAKLMKETGLSRAIQVHEKRIEILNELLASGELTEKQTEKVTDKIEHTENVTAQLEELEENKNTGNVSKVTGEVIRVLEEKLAEMNNTSMDKKVKEQLEKFNE